MWRRKQGGTGKGPSHRHIGNRRRDCWWDPIYNPSLELDPEPWDWDLHKDSGPSARFIPGVALNDCVTPGVTLSVRDKTFRNCDFQGDFKPNALMMFERCRFIGCDFAYSRWYGAHFKSCTFTDSSLSLANFESCDFRESTWERIGVASKTELVRTFFSNPAALIKATVSNTNVHQASIEQRLHQWHRLLGTRAHFLRTIMISHESIGDEHTYYEAVKLHELQRASARVAKDVYDFYTDPIAKKPFAFVRSLLHSFDYAILRAFGWLNKWGESASRPCLALVSCYLMFAAIYKWWKFIKPIPNPFQKSFDITLLVGYSNQVQSGDAILTYVQDAHALIAIAIYSVFFATVISKLSRAR